MDSAIDIMATVRRAGGTDGSPPNRARSRSCSSNGRRAIGLCRPGRGTARRHLTVRPTQDLDFLTRPSAGDVRRVGEEFVAASHARSWSVEQVRDTQTFSRLLAHGPGRPTGRHRFDARALACCRHRRAAGRAAGSVAQPASGRAAALPHERRAARPRLDAAASPRVRSGSGQRDPAADRGRSGARGRRRCGVGGVSVLRRAERAPGAAGWWAGGVGDGRDRRDGDPADGRPRRRDHRHRPVHRRRGAFLDTRHRTGQTRRRCPSQLESHVLSRRFVESSLMVAC